MFAYALAAEGEKLSTQQPPETFNDTVAGGWLGPRGIADRLVDSEEKTFRHTRRVVER
jgi:hypothetical protein